MFTKEKTLKEGRFTTVEKGSWYDAPAIRKQYRLEQVERYNSETRNLDNLRQIHSLLVVCSIFNDDESRTLVYPYIAGKTGYEALDSSDAEENLSRILESLLEEGIRLSRLRGSQFAFVPEGHKTVNEPFLYCDLLLQGNDLRPDQLTELGRLQKIRPSIRWGRYDPELSNMIVTPERVHHIDYESMSLQDTLFPFAYSLVHLELTDQEKVSRKRFFDLTKSHITGSLCREDEFEDRMRLNLAEVCGYLILETVREDPDYRQDNKKNRKIEKLHKICEDML